MTREGPHVPTVLVIEDHRDNRELYAQYIRHQRLRVIETDNTSDALAHAPAADVIVTGIRVLGPFDGVELVRRLRADERTSLTPIIVVTACTFEPYRRRAYAAGCDAFLAKPCLPEALVLEIRRLLERRSPSRGVDVPPAGTSRGMTCG